MSNRVRRAVREIVSLLVGWIAVLFQMLYGLWKLSKVPRPRVTFFGGAKLQLDDQYARHARKLAQMCVENDISVVTGGGPGIMEAANCGVFQFKEKNKVQRTIGISVGDIPGEKNINVCVTDYNIVLKYFFARKWLLIQYSNAFVVFPGGFGTLDEMAEVLTLIKTKKRSKVPVVLFDSKYWNHFISWVDTALEKDLISQEDRNLVVVKDSIEQVFEIVKNECSKSRI